MIGHYLLTLTPEQEDRVLTTGMRPGDYTKSRHDNYGPCLVGVVCGNANAALSAPTKWRDITKGVEFRYDDLCDRFGVERVNTAIRSRILANQARRTLRQEAAHVGA